MIIVAPHNFQEREFFDTKSVFDQNKFEIDIASTTSNNITGSSGTSLKPDITFEKIDVCAYDGLVIIGGFGARDYLWDNLNLRDILQEAYKKKKIIAAICLAPVILAKGPKDSKDFPYWIFI